MAKARDKEPVKIEPTDVGPVPVELLTPPVAAAPVPPPPASDPVPPAPVEPAKPDPLAGLAAHSAAGTRRARVAAPGTHVGVIDVEIPRDSADPRAAAIAAAKEKRGIVSFGAAPDVELLD